MCAIVTHVVDVVIAARAWWEMAREMDGTRERCAGDEREMRGRCAREEYSGETIGPSSE